MAVMALLVEHDPPEANEAWRPAPAPEPRESRHRATRRILLVEDDLLIRGMLERLLSEAGYAVVSAANGRAALALAADAVPFDLVITDLRMPVMDGRELGRRLRRAQPNLPLLYISAYDADLAPQAHEGSGAASFLRKPFDPDEMLRHVAGLLGGP
jgi:two-component system cell cycle sensor histidine kinase/response regulator CckA